MGVTVIPLPQLVCLSEFSEFKLTLLKQAKANNKNGEILNMALTVLLVFCFAGLLCRWLNNMLFLPPCTTVHCLVSNTSTPVVSLNWGYTGSHLQ